jgi:hypothetical protein
MFEIVKTESKDCNYNSRSWYDYHEETIYDPAGLARVNYLNAKDQCSEPEMALHKQPDAVLKAVVALAEVLRKKDLIDDAEFLKILGVEYDQENYKVKELY